MSNFPQENINRLWSTLIINELVKNNITHFYLSPGMRNAPLIAAILYFKKINSQIEIFNCFDERGASYRALGYTKTSGKPAVLICTSGTALANYYPAVIEAYKMNLPLIVLSADRPAEQAFSDDNQTINQNNIYSHFVRGELNLGAPSFEISPRALTTSISNLLARAMGIEKGPIHFNCPFREPLENIVKPIPEDYLKKAINLIQAEVPATNYLKVKTVLEAQEMQFLFNQITNAQTGILVIGSLPPLFDTDSLRFFINELKWPVYLDVSSSLKYEYSLVDNAIPTFDHPEVVEALMKNQPQFILHIGGRLTSKHYYSLLNALDQTHLISINQTAEKEDPSHNTKTRIYNQLNAFLFDFNKLFTETKTSPKKFLLDFKNFVETKRKIIEDAPLTYPSISKMLIENLPDQTNLYIANSTVVRSFDSYCSIDHKKIFSISTNRGVSGIEGFIASAIGNMDAKSQDVYLVIGDISFMHDLNSLFSLRDLKNNLKIILINNNGGGIFTLLPIQKEEDVLSVITSPHKEKFNTIALNFNMFYKELQDIKEFPETIKEFQKINSHALLEITVDHKLNQNIYNQLKTIKLS